MKEKPTSSHDIELATFLGSKGIAEYDSYLFNWNNPRSFLSSNTFDNPDTLDYSCKPRDINLITTRRNSDARTSIAERTFYKIPEHSSRSCISIVEARSDHCFPRSRSCLDFFLFSIFFFFFSNDSRIRPKIRHTNCAPRPSYYLSPWSIITQDLFLTFWQRYDQRNSQLILSSAAKEAQKVRSLNMVYCW